MKSQDNATFYNFRFIQYTIVFLLLYVTYF